MNKKIVIRFMVAMVLFMSFFLCDKGICNTGTIEAYAKRVKTDEWEGSAHGKEISLQKYKGNETIVEIPSEIDGYTVVAMESYLFEEGNGIKSITIPESVRSIEEGVFAKGNYLTSIVVDKKNKVYDSRDNCNAIIETSSDILIIGCENTVIPKSVKEIGYEAFVECSGLKSITIPNSVTVIDTSAFSGCSSLKSITIPDSVKEISGCTFQGCSSLESITLMEGITSIESSAFDECSSLTSVKIPESVKNIEYMAFSRCTSLTSIVIPRNVKEIGSSLFYGCTNLTSIVVDKNNSVYDSRDNCNAIIETASNKLMVGCQNTLIPKSVTEIGDSAFSGCNGLESITIPETVTRIGDLAFANCSSLTSIIIPKSVTYIGERAFEGCSSLKSITIPDSVTKIKPDVFNGCSGLKSIVIPEGVTRIDRCAFDGCSSLTSITIPDSVTKIEYGAFSQCTSLTSIVIPQSVKNIDSRAFYGCNNLTSIVVDKKNKVYDSRNNCNAIVKTSSKTLIVGCKNTVIPKGIKIVGAWAFAGCGNLKNIKIPDSVTKIEAYAFTGCTSLESITIPKSVTKIESWVFEECSSLKNVKIPNSVKEIGNAAFYKCSSLKSIKIPDSVTKIGFNTFSECSSLKSVTIPSSVKEIGIEAFYKCSSLKSIKIPDSVTNIYRDAFSKIGKNFIIYSSDGSYAHKYARENKIKWKDSNSGSVDSFLISIGKTTYTYDGKGKKPSVTVDMGGTKLKKGTDYTVEYANNVNVGTAKVIIAGTGKYSGKVTKTFTINPSKVKDLKQNTSYYSNAISLTWEKMPGVDGYKIYRATSENGTYKKVATVKKTTYKNNKLEPAKTYYYKVYAYKSKVKGEFSDAVAAGTKTKEPTLNVVGGKKNATLTWEEVTGADGYEVYMKAGKSGKYKKVKTVKANTTVFTKSKLAKGKKYSFKIRTFRTVSGKKIYSDWSAVKSVKIK